MESRKRKTEKRTLVDRLGNRLFAIPAVVQFWAKFAGKKTNASVSLSSDIPLARLGKPLSQCRAALVTTGGIHLLSQVPFDMENREGDATYREIPDSADPAQIMITHKYYDHQDADRDLNVIFPRAHFYNLVESGVLGDLATRHFGFMGHVEGEKLSVLKEQTAPAVAERLQADDVDFAFLTPA